MSSNHTDLQMASAGEARRPQLASTDHPLPLLDEFERSWFVSRDACLTLGGAAPPREVTGWPVIHVCVDGEGSHRLAVLLDSRTRDWFRRQLGVTDFSVHLRPSLFEAWLPLSRRGEHPPAGLYFPTDAIRAMINQFEACSYGGSLRQMYLAAKALELTCETLAQVSSGELRLAGDDTLSFDDVRRLQEARRLVYERYADKLTLDRIAKACGLNRAKLTRGYRELFKSSIGEALTERRLQEAASRLRSSDAPVSSIGFAAGYLSNAAFTRAFSRRFGYPPTVFRTALSSARVSAANRIAIIQPAL